MSIPTFEVWIQIFKEADPTNKIKLTHDVNLLKFLSTCPPRSKQKWQIIEYFLNKEITSEICKDFITHLYYPDGYPIIDLRSYCQHYDLTLLTCSRDFLAKEIKSMTNYDYIANIKDGVYKHTIFPVTYMNEKYYWEANSLFLLYSKLTLVSRNIFGACLALDIPSDLILETLLSTCSLTPKDLTVHDLSNYPSDTSLADQWNYFIKLTIQKIFDPLKPDPKISEVQQCLIQLLKEKAKSLNIDVIVLKYQTAFDFVSTEILDFRKPEESFQSLLFLQD